MQTYITEDPRVEEYKAQINQLEAELQQRRNTMDLGYTDPQVCVGRGRAAWGGAPVGGGRG